MLTLVTTGEAQAHYTPKKFHSHSEKVVEFLHREDHALDVARFFHNHRKLANTKAGHVAIRQHKVLLKWSKREILELDDIKHIHQFSNKQLTRVAKEEVANGGTYSVRYGDCSERLKILSRELVERAFAPYGTEGWAFSIINRESGFCPGAVNTTYSDPQEQAQCIAQFIPNVHTWVDYKRCKSDPAYSVEVFLHLSKGGTYTSPWS